MNRVLNIALLIGTLALAACSGASGPDGAGVAEQASGQDRLIRRGNGGEPGSLDPALAEDVHAFSILVDLYEGLLSETADGGLAPGVASSWHISDDGLSYTFQLRPDARWSSGDAVVAADFVRALRRVASPDTASSYSFLLEPLLNFGAVKRGDMPAQELGANAIDALTLELQLAKPTSHFLAILAMPISFPIHAEMAESRRFSDPASFVGNGPYLLAERQAGGVIRLRRNDAYRDRDSVAVANIDYLPVTDPELELRMYRAGELDITNTIPPGQIEKLSAELSGHVRIAPSNALYYLAFDLSEPPFDQLLLRKALTMAIDRQRLVKLIGRGELPAFGIVPPGVADHVGARYSWQNASDEERIASAIRAYRDAGYDRDRPLKLRLTYDVGDIHERIALAVSGMWQQVLGVDIELDKKEWMLFLDTRDKRADWQVMRFSWFGDYNSATTFTEIFRSDSPQNLPLYRNADYDQLLISAESAFDPERRTELMTRAEQVLINDYPIAPLYFYVSKHLVSPRIHGFEDSIHDRHPSKYLDIEPVE